MQPVRKDLSPAEVRNFGWITLGGFAVIGGLLWVKGLGWTLSDGVGWRGSGWHLTAVILWSIGAGFAVICTTSHAVGLKLYVGWMTGAMYVGTVVSTVLLSILFFVLLPVFALIRFKDPLRLRLGGSDSYWEDHPPYEATLERSMRQF
jgi:riboflavin transporter FmnP